MSKSTSSYPIYPSLLAFDFGCLKEQIEAVTAAGAVGVHFDVMDGHFVPNLTFGAPVLRSLHKHTALPLNAHLMVYHPESFIEPFANAGASRLYIHPEATPHINRALAMVREHGMQAGVAINPGTPIAVLAPVLEMVDAILVMSVNPGFGGQQFLPITYQRLSELRVLLVECGVSPAVECDGGVDLATIGPLVRAGMTAAVIGTGLFREGDPGDMLRRLQQAAVS